MTDIVIRATKSPALALTPTQFSQQHFDLFNNQLRLYFNTLDSFTANVSNTAGGSSLSFPHISALDTTDQYATANDTPTIVKLNTLDSGLGFTLDPAFYATADYTGYYKIDYSLQYANTDNAPHDVVVWLRVNNVDVPGSASKITVTSRKSAGVPSYVLMYSTVPFVIETGDEIALWWATDQAATSGGGLGIYMEYAPAQTVPYAHPSIPSAIGVITFVSRT